MRSWIAIASADHVAAGRTGGFMQVCHGKAAPLRRLSAGDRVIYYSSVQTMGGRDRVQAFTAVGRMRAGAPYQADANGVFQPWRRNVDWLKANATPIAPLLDQLEFTRGRRSWGAPFRFGLFEISDVDGWLIEGRMLVPELA